MMGELLQAEQVKGETDLKYAFNVDVWAEVLHWYEHFARDDELLSVEDLRKADTWKDVSTSLHNNHR